MTTGNRNSRDEQKIRLPYSTRNRSVRAAAKRLAALFIMCTLAGCDAYLVSYCLFEDSPACHVASGGSQMGKDGGVGGSNNMPDLKPPANGVERSFEYRAYIPLDGNKKYVGFNKGNAVFLLNSLQFFAMGSDLNNPDLSKRITSPSPDHYPTLTGVNFPQDFAYVTGEEFYLFKYSSGGKLLRVTDSSVEQVNNVTLAMQPAPSPFFHLNTNVLVAATAPNSSGLPNGVIAIFDRGLPERRDYSFNPTRFVVGDLDPSDNSQNGYEVITFSSDIVMDLYHYDTNRQFSVPDLELQTALSSAISRTKGQSGNTINAAYIADLNGDNFTDFIYSRNEKIYVTSYKGRAFMSFDDWSLPIITIPAGETVRSLAAVNLAADSPPELVVETNKAVYFYLNKP